MRTINRRAFALGISAVVAGVALDPTMILAQAYPVQGKETLGHGEGKPADAATSAKLVTFTENFFAVVNAKDGNAAMPMITDKALQTFFDSSTVDEAEQKIADGGILHGTLYGVDDVRMHPDGFASVRVTYHGLWPADQNFHIVATQRWYLAPFGSGYQFDDSAQLVPIPPKGMTSTGASLSLNNEGLTLSQRAFPKVDLLLLTVTNQEQGNWTTTGIYELPQGLHSGEAQAQLVSSWDAGNGVPGEMTFIMKTPMWPSRVMIYALQVKPGQTYFIEQWTLDSQGNNPQPLTGSQYIGSFSIAGA